MLPVLPQASLPAHTGQSFNPPVCFWPSLTYFARGTIRAWSTADWSTLQVFSQKGCLVSAGEFDLPRRLAIFRKYKRNKLTNRSKFGLTFQCFTASIGGTFSNVTKRSIATNGGIICDRKNSFTWALETSLLNRIADVFSNFYIKCIYYSPNPKGHFEFAVLFYLSKTKSSINEGEQWSLNRNTSVDLSKEV